MHAVSRASIQETGMLNRGLSRKTMSRVWNARTGEASNPFLHRVPFRAEAATNGAFKGRCTTLIRIRPELPRSRAETEERPCVTADGSVVVHSRGRGYQPEAFQFDHVYDQSATQEDLYAGTVDMLDGTQRFTRSGRGARIQQLKTAAHFVLAVVRVVRRVHPRFQRNHIRIWSNSKWEDAHHDGACCVQSG